MRLYAHASALNGQLQGSAGAGSALRVADQRDLADRGEVTGGGSGAGLGDLEDLELDLAGDHVLDVDHLQVLGLLERLLELAAVVEHPHDRLDPAVAEVPVELVALAV